MKNKSIPFVPRTPLEAELVRLAARGRRLSERDFVRIAVLRAACQTQGVFDLPAESEAAVEAAFATLGAAAARLAEAGASTAPGEAGQIAMRAVWKTGWDFQCRPQRDKKLWFQAAQEEQSALRQLKITAGEIVHGTRQDLSVSRNMLDSLREQAWMIPSNRVARKTGLPVIPLPDKSARIDDGVLSLAIGDSVARVVLRAQNRNAYPGSGVFEDAALEQVAGGRWSLYHSEYKRDEPGKSQRRERSGRRSRR